MENEWKVDGNTFSKVKDLTIPGNKHEFSTNQCNFQANSNYENQRTFPWSEFKLKNPYILLPLTREKGIIHFILKTKDLVLSLFDLWG